MGSEGVFYDEITTSSVILDKKKEADASFLELFKKEKKSLKLLRLS